MSTLVEYTENANSIVHAMFVNMVLNNTTYYLSDAYNPLTVDGNVYTNLGSLMSVSDIQDDYKSTQGTVTIAISGIPNTPDFMQIILNEKIKGGEVNMYRAFYDTTTLVQEANSFLRYKGIISNYNVEENTNIINGTSTNTLILSCSNVFSILSRKIAGQRTNGSSRRQFYTGDASFDNVRKFTSIPRFG
tara:strand:+ start:7271 stop:7840 length:570 start_codon:yes stop_codon:yes gene_type:complete